MALAHEMASANLSLAGHMAYFWVTWEAIIQDNYVLHRYHIRLQHRVSPAAISELKASQLVLKQAALA